MKRTALLAVLILVAAFAAMWVGGPYDKPRIGDPVQAHSIGPDDITFSLDFNPPLQYGKIIFACFDFHVSSAFTEIEIWQDPPDGPAFRLGEWVNADNDCVVTEATWALGEECFYFYMFSICSTVRPIIP